MHTENNNSNDRIVVRIESLERTIRTQRALLFASITAAIVLFVFSGERSRADDEASKTIVANQFVVVGDDNKPRAILGVLPTGDGFVSVVSRDGKSHGSIESSILKLTCTSDAGESALDRTGRFRYSTVLNAYPLGSGLSMNCFELDGDKLATKGRRPYDQIELALKHNPITQKKHSELSVRDMTGLDGITMTNEGHQNVIKLFESPSGAYLGSGVQCRAAIGGITLEDKDTNNRTMRAESSIVLFDSRGNVMWKVP